MPQRYTYRNKHSWQSGQTLAEFAIVAPLFFFIFFAVFNAGLMLFSMNAIQHAANVGAAEIAAEGNTPNDADQIAINAMDQAGLNGATLAQVSMITLVKEDVNTKTGKLAADTTGCSGAPCEDQYTATGQDDGVDNWPPSARNVESSNTDYAQLIVNYSYVALGDFIKFNLTSTVTFKLEPQSL